MLMSVGPVRPGVGIYSIIEEVLCKVYLKKNRFGGQIIVDICSFAYVCGVYSIVEVVVSNQSISMSVV